MPGVYSYISRPIHDRLCKDLCMYPLALYTGSPHKNGGPGMRLPSIYIHLLYVLRNY